MAAIRFPEGTTFRQQFTITDETGTVVDLTGASLTFAVYQSSAAKVGVVAALFTKTIGSGITISAPTTGVCRIDFDPADTVDMAGTYDWELELVESNNDVYMAGSGQLIVSPARRLDA